MGVRLDGQWMFERGRVPLMLLLILLIVPLSPMAPEASVIADSTDAHASTSGRALTTWSGSVSVTSDYTVTTSNELRILACTNVSSPVASGSSSRVG